MADKNYVIGVDSGTQSVRAVLFDRQGRVVALTRAPHEPYYSLEPGWAEQSPDDYWSKFCRVTNELMNKATIDSREIAGLGLTTQRGTFVPVDRQGNALRSAIIWLDQRKVPKPMPSSAVEKVFGAVTGLSESIRFVRKNSKFMWIRQCEPEIYRKTYKFMQISGWFVHRLTGEFKDSVGMVTGIWPMDYRKLAWYPLRLAYRPFGIEPEHMVDIFPPDTVLGHVTARAASETGLPEGLPVVVGAGDKQSELLGAGAVDQGVGVISYGTASCMEIITYKYIMDPKLRFLTWPAAIPNAWDLELFISRGFWMVTWFKQEFGHREALEAQRRGVATEVVLDEIVRTIPPGSMGLMIQPYWTPIVSARHGKGCIIGFGDVHTRAHIYRAILEGLGYELRRQYEFLNAKTGITLREIRVGGGGSRSDAAVQGAADIFNLPVYRMATFETCALGAAIDAAVGTGMFGSFNEAARSMVKKGRMFEPDPKAHRIYDDLYNEVYTSTSKALEPLCRSIARITGYPPED
jgi:sugar (pentulose or hexulose) kinase